jgi:hypothetical protein
MGLIDNFKKLKFWGRGEERGVKDELAKIGVFSIADPKLQERLKEYEALIKMFDVPICDTVFKDEKGVEHIRAMIPDERLDAWNTRLQTAYFLYQRIAIPYLRVMDKENNIYGVAIKSYETLWRVTQSMIDDFKRIFKKEEMINKSEVMAGFEFWLHAYILKWLFTIIGWSFTGQDVAPSYSITVHAVAPQRGFTPQPSGLDLPGLSEKDRAEREAQAQATSEA